MSAPDLFEDLLAFVQDAAALALRLQDDGLTVAYKGGDFGQALTEADRAISRMMRERFGGRLVEEETAEAISHADTRALLGAGETSVVGDPIDGTASYAGGLPGWGCMVAACRHGWPVASAAILPAWCDRRLPTAKPTERHGVLLAAREGVALWAETIDGRMAGALQPLVPRLQARGHVGWLPVASQHFTLDYTKGFFPLCEGGFIADAAAAAMARIDATTFNHKLWDLVPTLPILEAAGFRLFRWPDLAAPPGNVADLFGADYACHPGLWLVCRSRGQAAKLGSAIARARPDTPTRPRPPLRPPAAGST